MPIFIIFCLRRSEKSRNVSHVAPRFRYLMNIQLGWVNCQVLVPPFSCRVDMASVSGVMNIQFVDETGNMESEDFDRGLIGRKRRPDWEGAGEEESDSEDYAVEAEKPRPGKKTRGRVKIRMAYINDKVRRYTTFSKRKTGIMKKAYELAVLTGTQVMLLVASETGHVYTFATKKLQPVIMSENGKALIQTCLNSPDTPSSPPHSKDVATVNKNGDERMNPLGFEEPNLMYTTTAEEKSNASPHKQSSCKVDAVPKPENPVMLAAIPVLGGTLDQSTLPKASASISQQAKPIRQPVTVGAYLAAIKDPSPAVSFPESIASGVSQTVAKPEKLAPNQQLYYQIEGSNQLISIPIESCAKLANVNNDLKLKSTSLTTQPIAVVNSGATAGGGMVMYPGQQTVVLPVPGSAATTSLLSEGYVLNFANTSNLSMAPEALGSNSQQLFTLPFTVSSSQISQQDSTKASLVNQLLSFVDTQNRFSQRK